MNRWLTILSLACVLVAATGCQRRDAQEPQGYDPDLDGSPESMQVYMEPDIAIDQSLLSATAEETKATAPAAPTAEPSGATTRPTGGKTAAVFDFFKKAVTAPPK